MRTIGLEYIVAQEAVGSVLKPTERSWPAGRFLLSKRFLIKSSVLLVTLSPVSVSSFYFSWDSVEAGPLTEATVQPVSWPWLDLTYVRPEDNCKPGAVREQSQTIWRGLGIWREHWGSGRRRITPAAGPWQVTPPRERKPFPGLQRRPYNLLTVTRLPDLVQARLKRWLRAPRAQIQALQHSLGFHC